MGDDNARVRRWEELENTGSPRSREAAIVGNAAAAKTTAIERATNEELLAAYERKHGN